MKQVALRMAGALLATAICLGASTRAHVPASYAPATANATTKGGNPGVTTFTGTGYVYVGTSAVVRSVTRQSMTHSLERVDPVAQFDVTK